MVDGELTVFTEEERFMRLKHAPSVHPIRAIHYCLVRAGLKMDDIDVMAVGFAPPPRGMLHEKDIDNYLLGGITPDSSNYAQYSRALKYQYFDLLIINPPFGRRMGSLKQSDALFQDLCKRLKAVWGGWRVALVVPRKSLLKRIPFPFSAQEIRHGGLRLYLTTGVLRS